MQASGAAAVVKRIAMWSGARSLSTALMRAWESRSDTVVWDEPLSAPYFGFLTYQTPEQNHGQVLPDVETDWAQDILAETETDWVKVREQILHSSIGNNKTVHYQKYISSQFLPGSMGMDWLLQLDNGLLIRNPKDMLLSLSKRTSGINLQRTGLSQLELVFQHILDKTGQVPPIVDATDLQNNPQRILPLLCDAFGVDFSDSMLSWPAGRREQDGAWATDWYQSVEKSTRFYPSQSDKEPFPEHLEAVLEQCEEIYLKLYECRLH